MSKSLVTAMVSAAILGYMFTIYMKIANIVNDYSDLGFVAVRIIPLAIPIVIALVYLRVSVNNNEWMISVMLLIVSSLIFMVDIFGFNEALSYETPNYAINHGLGVILSLVVLVYASGKLYIEIPKEISSSWSWAYKLIPTLIIIAVLAGSYFTNLWRRFY